MNADEWWWMLMNDDDYDDDDDDGDDDDDDDDDDYDDDDDDEDDDDDDDAWWFLVRILVEFLSGSSCFDSVTPPRRFKMDTNKTKIPKKHALKKHKIYVLSNISISWCIFLISFLVIYIY